MKKLIFTILLLSLSFLCFKIITKKEIKHTEISKTEKFDTERIVKETSKLKNFIHDKPQYNPDIVFVIDMKIASGKNRFFAYNLKTNSIIDQGIVAHGSGSETGINGKLKFSNKNNSFCTSLGKYTIGYSYNGKFGKAYKLYGLDKSNDNAIERNIVLHKYAGVPYSEQDFPICNSLGCPMVSETYFKRIEKIIDCSKQKIILAVFY